MAKPTTLDEYLKLDLKNNHFRYMSDEIKNELISRTTNCHGTSLDERAYWLQKNMTKYPTCLRCGVSHTSKSWYPSINRVQQVQGWPQKGYRPYCGRVCAMNAETKHTRTIQTSIDKYNVPHAAKSIEFQAKRKLTNLKRYGAANPMAWSSERFKSTIQELYGVTAVRHIPGVARKIEDTKAAQTLVLLKERSVELESFFNVTLLSELPTQLTKLNDVELRWQHSCGNVFTSNITSRGLRNCPRCSYGSSSAERALGDWLENTGETVIRRDRSFGFEIDLYLPERNLGIEYDGTYWHSARFVSREKAMEKLESCERAGLQLITLQEHLWLLQEDKVKARLNSVLNRNASVMGRKCKIQWLTAVKANEFLVQTHLQKSARAQVHLGLELNDETLAVMTFGRPRFSKNADWELIRYASKSGLNIQGGASRLLAAFRTAHTGSIISYADRCWSYGALYKALGFRFVRNSKPSYFWVSGQHILTRYQTQKKKLPKLLADINRPFEPALSEADNMLTAKFLQVFDRGNSVWMLD